MESQEQKAAGSNLTPSMYSNRVMLKTVLESSDGGDMGLVGKTVVVGGWVKSSKEVKNHPAPLPPDASPASPERKGLPCLEILESRIPCFRTIIRILCGPDSSPSVREKLESLIPKPSPSSTLFLLINDGSCVSTLQVSIDSTKAPMSAGQILSTGTCILAQGVLQKASSNGKQTIELKAEKILHVGKVEQDKYPLSRKRLPLDSLRDYPHIRPRTTTVSSVTRIRSTLDFASHTFFWNHDFLHVQMPIITTTDAEGFSEKFQVTTLPGKTSKKEETLGVSDANTVSLEIVKAAIKEKSSVVELLQRSDSNKEALLVGLQDLQKTNELAQQIEAREKLKPVTAVKPDSVKFDEDFFGRQSYLTVSGRLHLWILVNCSEDMKFVSRRIDKTITHRLEYMTTSSFDKISYREAVEILRKVPDKAFEAQLQWGVPLTAEHLSYLADDHYKRPVIIYDYPKAVKPFYVCLNDDGTTVAAFEMVAPKGAKMKSALTC
ncbi:hypothetical protein F3Y22_tig00111088pilonHSYRG00035 [Hibiscus syriacus]|uniref:Asparagine--tRNA ligase n=1 Tax=Hibiscus syriacus TaxID=106335 RepID=A0A6A2Z448_HIBSY|nr:hypothetical protein F3Y22_tig00111088pilonHSYRG00035 [Hibiscus syriacus]